MFTVYNIKTSTLVQNSKFKIEHSKFTNGNVTLDCHGLRPRKDATDSVFASLRSNPVSFFSSSSVRPVFARRKPKQSRVELQTSISLFA